MCLFSGPVNKVSSTSIFARDAGAQRQVLAYEMTVAMDEAVAMVLPLPVPSGAGEDALRFIDLSNCRDLFDQLRAAFPDPLVRSAAFSLGANEHAAQLVVHEVGDYEASFVPTLADFSRLDPRFRMADGVWSRLPQYTDYGFAVFKLAKRAEWKPAHPIAFEFPRRDDRLFFPTVHVHDGEVNDSAFFDHELYAQSGNAPEHWRRSEAPAGDIVRDGDPAGLFDPAAHVHQRKLTGMYLNADVRV
jgi:hypothetical protein